MTEARPKQSVPGEIKADLLSAVRNSFYADAPEQQWHQDKAFIARDVVLWPAAWLNNRGVTLPPERYKAIILDVFNGIKQHGCTGAIKYWPGYLKHCLQTHFRYRGEAYYNEAKALRGNLDSLLKKAAAIPTVDPIRVLAEHRKDLLQSSRKPAAKALKDPQMTLF